MVVFDIGNTDTVVGFFHGNELKEKCRIQSLKSENSLFFDYRILNFIKENNIPEYVMDKAVISSVVPILTPFFINFCEKHLKLKPLIVDPVNSHLLNININIPNELGSDLYLNALAASDLYGGNCVVVDFGTALSFTSISAQKEILGVNIVPGVNTALRALFTKTSLLPEVKIERPDKVIGKNTVHAIQSGIYYGYESLVRGLVQKIKSEIGGDVKVIATGGLSSVIVELRDVFDDINIDLTLNGLYIYAQKVKS